jgi:CRISPR-associated protein (TIGR03984 family)
MPTLYGRTSSDITLSEALKNCAAALSNNGNQGIALLYSPTCCQFAKVTTNGILTNFQGETITLNDVFEVRAFNETSELRWLNNLGGKGQAVLISESDICNYLQEYISSLIDLNIIEQEYILWGEAVTTSVNAGWQKLAKSRIGSIHVPVTGLNTNQRVYLTAIEYLKADEEYGNVSVVEERLTGLEVK